MYQLRKLDVFLHSIIGLKRKKANASCLTRIKPDPIAFSACPLSVRGVGVGGGGCTSSVLTRCVLRLLHGPDLRMLLYIKQTVFFCRGKKRKPRRRRPPSSSLATDEEGVPHLKNYRKLKSPKTTSSISTRVGTTNIAQNSGNKKIQGVFRLQSSPCLSFLVLRLHKTKIYSLKPGDLLFVLCVVLYFSVFFPAAFFCSVSILI